MSILNPVKASLAMGVVLAGWHVTWSLLVALNLGQPIYDFVLWAHMIHMQLSIGPFDLMASATLVVLTFFFGAALGFAFALVWNRLHRA